MKAASELQQLPVFACKSAQLGLQAKTDVDYLPPKMWRACPIRPLIFHMPCLVRLSLIFFLNGTIDCHFISDIMDYFLAGEDQQQTNQPNDLAGG